jgi:hypothetical protein
MKEAIKKHWKLALGAGVGLVLLLLLLRHASASSASPASGQVDISGGANQVQSLSAAADLANSSANVQIATTQLNDQVATANINAQLQAKLAETAAQLSLGNEQTRAAEVAALGAQHADVEKALSANASEVQINRQNVSGAVQIQGIQSAQAVSETSIKGATLENLARTEGQTQVQLEQVKSQVALTQLADVSSQIGQIFKYSKHAGADLTAFTPLAATELGQPGASAAASAANAESRTSGSTAATISAASKGVSTLLTGLFG